MRTKLKITCIIISISFNYRAYSTCKVFFKTIKKYGNGLYIIIIIQFEIIFIMHKINGSTAETSEWLCSVEKKSINKYK